MRYVFLNAFQSEIESAVSRSRHAARLATGDYKSASAAAVNGDRCSRSRRLAARVCRWRRAFKTKDAALVSGARIRIERVTDAGYRITNHYSLEGLARRISWKAQALLAPGATLAVPIEHA